MKSKKKQLEKRDRKAYLEGLKKYEEKGIPLYIDDEPAKAEDMERIFEIQEDGSFYMGDYVGADTGRLKEIRFNKVYSK